jgi:hypothetical protein
MRASGVRVGDGTLMNSMCFNPGSIPSPVYSGNRLLQLYTLIRQDIFKANNVLFVQYGMLRRAIPDLKRMSVKADLSRIIRPLTKGT